MNLYVDIETFGHAPEEAPLVLPTEDDIKVGNIKDPEKIRLKVEAELPKLIDAAKAYHLKAYEEGWRKNALKSLHSDIIALSYAIDLEAVESITGTDEEICRSFNDVLKDIGHPRSGIRLVAHNGFGFDFPFLFHRGVRYKLLSLATTFNVTRHSLNVDDTQAMFAGSQWGAYYSLSSIGEFLGLGGKEGMTGSEVHDYYIAGKLDEIVKYSARDVSLLRAIHQRLLFNF